MQDGHNSSVEVRKCPYYSIRVLGVQVVHTMKNDSTLWRSLYVAFPGPCTLYSETPSTCYVRPSNPHSNSTLLTEVSVLYVHVHCTYNIHSYTILVRMHACSHQILKPPGVRRRSDNSPCNADIIIFTATA
jgi:hypothetical protein